MYFYDNSFLFLSVKIFRNQLTIGEVIARGRLMLFLKHCLVDKCVEIRYGITWLATESACAQSKHSTIFTGKLKQ